MRRVILRRGGSSPVATGRSTFEDEHEVLDSRAAAELAAASRDRPDPFPGIHPSLLSADHIEDYVRRTGMIAPFHLGGGRKARLKKASYEGRMGSRVYRYDEHGNLVLIPMYDGVLVVPANSIVFVESGIEFRLPDYMAIRFNLQIVHVHRGLLLGTGPLVDPGFWGKLCIPLHNLTDQPYAIPIDEGLIWIEFTKTTSVPTRGRDAMGAPDEKREFWNIEELVRKASAAPSGRMPPVPIRSSITSMVTTANARADAASQAAAKASDDSRRAASEAREAKGVLNRLAYFAGIAILLSLVALYASYHISFRSEIATMQGSIAGFGTSLGELKGEVSSLLDDESDTALESRVRALERELARALDGSRALGGPGEADRSPDRSFPPNPASGVGNAR